MLDIHNNHFNHMYINQIKIEPFQIAKMSKLTKIGLITIFVNIFRECKIQRNSRGEPGVVFLFRR